MQFEELSENLKKLKDINSRLSFMHSELISIYYCGKFKAQGKGRTTCDIKRIKISNNKNSPKARL